MVFLIIRLLVALLVLNGPALAGEVYTWTDKDGNIHITDRPPADDAQVDSVIRYSDKITTRPPVETPPSQQDTAEAIQKKQLDKQLTRLGERESQLEKIIAENQESITEAEKELEYYSRRSGSYARRNQKTIQRQLVVLRNNLTTYQSDLRYVEEDIVETKQFIKAAEEKRQRPDGEINEPDGVKKK